LSDRWVEWWLGAIVCGAIAVFELVGCDRRLRSRLKAIVELRFADSKMVGNRMQDISFSKFVFRTVEYKPNDSAESIFRASKLG
jgi:hypothetical protein